jgi:hypothetical protein
MSLDAAGGSSADHSREALPHAFRLGELVLDLLDWPEEWIDRRIETICFDDDRTATRSTALDIILPDPVPELFGRAVLPIAMHPRNPARNVVVATAAGEPLPFLNREQERGLVAAGLVAGSYDLLDEQGIVLDQLTPDDRYLLVLRQIESTLMVPGEAREAVDDVFAHQRLLFEDELQPYWEEFQKKRLVIALPAIGPEEAANRPTLVRINERHAEELIRPDSYRHEFDIPTTTLYATGKADDAASLSNALYDKTHEFVVPPPSGHVSPWKRKAHADDLYVTVPTELVRETRSYHIEFTCPPGVYVDYGVLVVVHGVRADGSDAPGEMYDIEILEVEDDDPHWATAHFYYNPQMSRLPSRDDEEANGILEAALCVVLRPMYHGVMRSGANVAFLTTALLVVLAFSLGYDAADYPLRLHLPLDERDTNSLVSLLLLVPSVALAVLVRQDEHLMTKYVIDRYRLRLGILALDTFAVAILFAVGLSGAWLFWSLLTAAVVAAVCSVHVCRSAIHSRDQLRSQAFSA